MRAPYDTTVNFYGSGGYGVVGALLGSEPARFVTATYIASMWPYFPLAEFYVTCDGTNGPFDVPKNITAPGFVDMQYANAVILEDDNNPGVFYQLLLRQEVLLPLGGYTRYHCTAYPYP